ncbi:valine--tRNA ligase [bacterium (Candidatus Blackallbacteria) CG17_big_fil_post_rev_8_21_14_2_50_48_46]|uniref:Valine--tRNA ligase n=1 Tax=bacterium (Candidatus Blackallbacteria) CG17_big_fil_post_rev_8_21_14_2_50_48_46 TaxID=2014261 RepID=A0A2M7G4J5_9BACT|nr:MAG: valine--tRNA ligase [bacterium (Candidatus Blackallbacteria) CG18_big_fil_WC_8_21_14_2_50_49_26]PIW16800.1 MAG: valine--tRNA ligase [bacterium (Candidatus Blackallbacteria) CG17_big_fil_post_rev_8_21_14_2_50_48_46]PIW47997.1 MAG: valine--tRNA ligase [bacterium (Candidatus Blackallbacteria) CG13_big_fil_rev_8_21_14_2_50_49_14]
MTSMNLPTRFDFSSVEAKWNKIWEEKGYFHPEVNPEQKPYTIAFPPPNVTGVLHMGHACNATLQDVLIRSRRMQGCNTLWMLGTDHAGIATQIMVERKIKKELGKTRHDLGRTEFLKHVWAWKEEHGNQIINQMRRLGASGDYDRARFTMDEGYSRAIRKVFVEWYQQGLIYRGERLVNWDPVGQTVLSDLEIEQKEENGQLFHIRYPLSSNPEEFLTVATTRPETLVGDMAVAVHPKDERYRHLLGQTVNLPLTDRKIPIIADEMVEFDFGSGAVKITPAHDFNDWDCGQRHQLPLLQVIGQDAKMNENAPEKYQGLPREEARKAMVADLEALGLLEKIDAHVYMPSRSERSGAIIEPLPMVQWWVNMKPLAAPAIEAIKNQEVRYTPDRWSRITVEWLENIRDWCISRQLWWGHQIPVWYDAEGQIAYVGMEDPSPEEMAAKGLTRDEDVLDTWFSSALWTFATLGWPDQTPELKQFHPTAVLSTAREILYLWVARMIFCSLHFLGEIPFKDVLVHATILTKDGKRMSKSKGTGLDPLQMLDKYGADACRFWLAEAAMSGQDVRFSDEKLENGQHFVTKIWNASRFVLMNLEDYDPQYSLDFSQLELADRWILSRLRQTAESVSQALQSHYLTQATKDLYSFFWTEFCDWYLEIAKPRLQNEDRKQVQAILVMCLDASLRMLHPFMPFVTEELWTEGLKPICPNLPDSHLINAPWIEPESLPAADAEAEEKIGLIMETIRVIRNLRMEVGVPANKEAETVVLISDSEAHRQLLSENQLVLGRMGKVQSIQVQLEAVEIPQSAHGVSQGVQVILPLAGLIDLEKEKERLQKEIQKHEKDIKALSARLENPNFRSRAPEDVVQEVETQLSTLRFQQQTLQERLSQL